LAQADETLRGTWHCTGAIHGPDGAAESEVTVNVALDRELDGAWLRTTFTVTSGKYPYKFTSYRTFDASANVWTNVIVDNLRGLATSKSADGATWLGESSGPVGAMKIRDTETIVSAHKMRMRGEYSRDGGWALGYELGCER
jgi:hypothetical protein